VRLIAASLGVSSRIGITAIAIVARLIFLPLVAGLAYEITVKWAGNHSTNPFVKILLWPGMQLQRMTTREPTDDMVEVAVAAMVPIIAREQREERILPRDVLEVPEMSVAEIVDCVPAATDDSAAGEETPQG
jgi:uncharacterized protein YqhQ